MKGNAQPRPLAQEQRGGTSRFLNSYFAGVSVSPHENIEEAMDGMNLASEEGFTFKPTNFDRVVFAMKHFSSQARGADGVPQSVIAKALPAIGDLIVNIFDSSSAHNILPEAWKQAQLIALRKTAAPSAVSDFHPIALLCFLSKVLGKIAHDQITEYFENTDLLDHFQTGSKQHHSTQTALLELTDDIRVGVDREKIILLLLFDLSKAFDTISPSNLMSKLRNLASRDRHSCG